MVEKETMEEKKNGRETENERMDKKKRKRETKW